MKDETVRVLRISLKPNEEMFSFVDRKIRVGARLPDGSRLLTIPMDDQVRYFKEGRVIVYPWLTVKEKDGVRKELYMAAIKEVQSYRFQNLENGK